MQKWKKLHALLGPGPKYSFVRSFLYIFLSSLLVTPLTFWLIRPGSSLKKTQAFPIKNIFLVCQKTSDLLPATFFSEPLGLYADAPTFLHEFSTTAAEDKLKQIKIFSFLSIDKVPDNKGIVISYSLKTPMAYLANLSNTFFDEQGSLFPCLPFFKPKRLPKIFFPTQHSSSWNNSSPCFLPQEYLKLSKHLISHLQQLSAHTIDLSSIHKYPNEIIVSLECGHTLRLTLKGMDHALLLYKKLKPYLDRHFPGEAICDLRLPNTLLLKQEKLS